MPAGACRNIKSSAQLSMHQAVLLLAVCRAVSANIKVLSAETQLAARLQRNLAHPQTYKVHFAAKLENMTNSSTALKV